MQVRGYRSELWYAAALGMSVKPDIQYHTVNPWSAPFWWPPTNDPIS